MVVGHSNKTRRCSELLNEINKICTVKSNVWQNGSIQNKKYYSTITQKHISHFDCTKIKQCTN